MFTDPELDDDWGSTANRDRLKERRGAVFHWAHSQWGQIEAAITRVSDWFDKKLCEPLQASTDHRWSVAPGGNSNLCFSRMSEAAEEDDAVTSADDCTPAEPAGAHVVPSAPAAPAPVSPAFLFTAVSGLCS